MSTACSQGFGFSGPFLFEVNFQSLFPGFLSGCLLSSFTSGILLGHLKTHKKKTEYRIPNSEQQKKKPERKISTQITTIHLSHTQLHSWQAQIFGIIKKSQQKLRNHTFFTSATLFQLIDFHFNTGFLFGIRYSVQSHL